MASTTTTPQPRTVTLPDPLKPPAATAPTDVIGLRERGTDIEHRLDRRGLWWMLGRGARCDLTFPDDQYMSTTHAVINREPETGALILHDKSSKGATFINGVRVKTGGYLHDGVRIQLGATVLLAFSAESRDMWTPFERLVGASPAFAAARAQLIGAAESRSHVLLVGPRGSGKRTMAEALHQESQRAVGRFIEVDCAAAPAEVPSALALAAQAAAAGTVLVSNAAALYAAGLATLTDLLGAVGPDAARIVITISDADVVASHAWEPVRDQTFQIRVPSLWERTLDIAALVKSFVREFGVRNLALPAEHVAALAGREWPGEVAELRRVIGHAVVESKETLQLADLWPSDEARESDLRIALMRAVSQAPSGRLAAEGLGLPGTTFRRLVARFGISAG